MTTNLEEKRNVVGAKIYDMQNATQEQIVEWMNLLESPRDQLLAELLHHDVGINNMFQIEDVLRNMSRKKGPYVLYSGWNKSVEIFTVNQIMKLAKSILRGDDNLDRVRIFDLSQNNREITLVDIFELKAK